MSDALTPRVLAVENMVSRARAKTKSSKNAACPVCHVTLWVSLFFDGTGNHKEKDFPKNHSNVAALFDAHVNEPADAITALYYEGLGRQFNFADRYEEVQVASRGGSYTARREGYAEADGRMLGLGFADGISARLEKALFDLSKTIDDWRSQRRVDEINIAAFGFSRGATEARAFVHWLAAHSKVQVKGNTLSYDGIPMNFKFLGLFDTVESVGMAGTNKLPELIKTKVPTFVQKCTHIVAAHELREAFPLTIVNGNHRCVVYPGAHADIGGGYAANQQGRSHHLARIALLQMLDEARGAGLKMMSIGEMQASDEWTKVYKPSYDVPAEARGALNRYIADVKPKGSLRQHLQAHMTPYWNWIDTGLAAEDLHNKQRADANNRERQAEYQRMNHMLSFVARTPQGRGDATASTKAGVVPKSVADFFGSYVHDSFEHFSATGGTLQRDLSSADYYHIRQVLEPVS